MDWLYQSESGRLVPDLSQYHFHFRDLLYFPDKNVIFVCPDIEAFLSDIRWPHHTLVRSPCDHGQCALEYLIRRQYDDL
jgi:hypothetical protein